jgi:hypothetical protein
MTPNLRKAVLTGAVLGIVIYLVAFVSFRVGMAYDRRSALIDDGLPHASPVVLEASACGNKMLGPEKSACYRAAFAKRIATAGVESALVMLRTLSQQDHDVLNDEHMYAHGIGIDAFQQHPDMGATFPHCSPEFASGCYHGVLQAYFEARGKADSATVNGACAPFENSADKRFILFQCLHGMGHGIDMALDHDLPKTLAACDLLGEVWHRESCYGGAFMENIVHVTVPEHPATLLAAQAESARAHGKATAVAASKDDMAGMDMGHTIAKSTFKPIDPKNPLYPCTIVDDKYGPECYRIQTALMLYLNKGNFTATANTCMRAPLKFREYCFQSLGRDIAGNVNYQPGPGVRLCMVAASSVRSYCFYGLAQTNVDQAAKPQSGFATCELVQQAHDRAACYAAVGVMLLDIESTADARSADCQLPLPADAKACRKGARLPVDDKPPKSSGV